MLAEFYSDNWLDANSNPAGGVASGKGFAISWQNGPLGRGEDRKEPNGAFVETIIKAAKQRIEHYQTSKFNCQHNAEAIYHLGEALRWLNERTQKRETAGTEGTHST